MEPYKDDLRFGVVAVQKKFVTPDQVIDAMTVQIRKEMDKGKRKLIGDILVEMEYMTLSQKKEVLEDTRKPLRLGALLKSSK